MSIYIGSNNEEKDITIYDDLGSKNRRKFNILNIPFQNGDTTEKLEKLKSILIMLLISVICLVGVIH